jgi:hypothetical protein
LIQGAYEKAIIDGVTGKVSADKTLIITAPVAAGPDALAIPAGLDLTAIAADTLASVTAVTVAEGGSFTAAAATFAAATNITIDATATFSGALAPPGDITVGAKALLTIDNSGSLTIKAAQTLANAGTVALASTGGSVKLTSGLLTGGAKITGTGKLTAGKTEITGDWQAVGTHASGVTIAATSADAATITAASGEVFTAGAGAKITQLTGANNNLTIATATVIDLGGTTSAVGSIVLKKDDTNPGKLSFGATGATVKTGNTGGNALGAVGGVFAASSSTDDNEPPRSKREPKVRRGIKPDFRIKSPSLLSLLPTT